MTEAHANIPRHLLTAVAIDDVQVLLNWWDEVVHPIPDDDWGPSHPLWDLVLYVAYAIDDYGGTLLTEEQRISTMQREGLWNPALPMATA